MAIRTKTLQYWLGQETSSVASGSLYTYPSPTTIYIAETGSRVFRSVFAELFWRDINSATTNRGSVATQSLFLKLGNDNYTTASIITQLTDTGEHISYIGGVDLTDYFSSSFSNNNISQSCNWQFQYFIQNPVTQSCNIRGLAASLYITYNYDDTNTAIRSKTAVIPLAYTGTFTANVNRQLDIIPALNTYCTESNKTFDQIWLEMEGANGQTAGTNYSMSFFLDNEPKTASFEILNPTNVGTWIKNYFPLTHIDTSTTHSFNGGVSGTSVTPTSNALTIKATYRYNHDNSNYILNTPEYILEKGSSNQVFFTVDNDLNTNNYDNISIQEPEPIIQKNCAVKIYMSISAASTLKIYPKVGTFHFWSIPAGATEACGQLGQFRIDAEKASPFTGSAALLNRGDNLFNFQYSTAEPQRIGSISTTVVLNYISGKDVRGDGVHSHTVIALANSGSVTNSYLTEFLAGTIQYGKELMTNSPIYDNDYYISSHFIESYGHSLLFTTRLVSLDNVGENNRFISGSVIEKVILLKTDAENGVYRTVFPFGEYYTKHPRSVDIRNPLQSDIPRFIRSNGPKDHLRQVTTYHGISYTITGSISGYTGNGSGIIVECIESGSSNTNAGKIFQTVTNTGGAFSGSVYDNTKQYFVTARQSATLTSRSDDATGSIIIV